MKNKLLGELRLVLGDMHKDYLHTMKNFGSALKMTTNSDLEECILEYSQKLTIALPLFEGFEKRLPYSNERKYLNNIIETMYFFQENRFSMSKESAIDTCDNMYNFYTSLCVYLDVELKK